MALLYYSQGEYEKAVTLYQELFDQSHAQIHFDYLIQCYIALKDWKNAEQIVSEQARRFPKNSYYQVKQAVVFQQVGKGKEANEIYSKLIKKASKEYASCMEAGKACLDNKVDSVARIIYENGQAKNPENAAIVQNLSGIYLRSSDYKKLSEAYIFLLKNNGSQLDFIEGQLQHVLYEQNNTSLKNQLLTDLDAVIAKGKDIVVFKELYIWIKTQEKDFSKAIELAKDLDLELDEDGERLMELGDIALENKEFLYATDCFSFVVKKGPMADNYEVALRKLLETSYSMVFQSEKQPELQQIIDLEKEYERAYLDLQNTSSQVDVVKNLAHIKMFYLNKPDFAIELLKTAIDNPNFANKKSALELELADCYLFSGDIWSAHMLYASVALRYKNNDIGHTAQLQQAKIAYYTGKFLYAQALLDVLKGSTSKLIANDALSLAQLISDNTALDTTTTAMEIFARGDLLLYQKQYDEAIVRYDSVNICFPHHSLEDEILVRKATIASILGDDEKRVTYLIDIEQKFPYEIFADWAIYEIALYLEKKGEKESAKEKYKKIVTSYSNSFYAPIARNRYRELEKK
ncbi:MAG: tetratricopeptide repeat protein [Bacteroidales bacterium]|nr:tetratricopeptide repeat protein [Bacteroidales bacterium]